MNPFEERVLEGLGQWASETVFLVSVSGGADSTAMFAALAALRCEPGVPVFRLRCLHVEHGIRPFEESRGDALAVQELCCGQKVPCTLVHIPPGRVAETARKRGLGLEAAARLYRRAIWRREAARLGDTGDSAPVRVLTAHTKDDLLETVLMRFLRGSGPAGLAAMPSSRGVLLRPLLGLGRSEVLAYLSGRGISYRTDSTNADPGFLRNRIRLRLIPLLDRDFPGWRQAVLGLARTQGLAADFLADEGARRVLWKVLPGPSLTFPAKTFFAQPEIIREEALFQAADHILGIQAEAGKVPRRVQIRRFAMGDVSAMDAGLVRFEAGGGELRVRSAGTGKAGRTGKADGRGFFILLKRPGIYYIVNRLEVLVAGIQDKSGEVVEGFFALLPLALRDSFPEDRVGNCSREKALARGRSLGYTSSISAEDQQGLAAFIGTGPGGAGIVATRKDSPPVAGEHLVFVRVRGTTGRIYV